MLFALCLQKIVLLRAVCLKYHVRIFSAQWHHNCVCFICCLARIEGLAMRHCFVDLLAVFFFRRQASWYLQAICWACFLLSGHAQRSQRTGNSLPRLGAVVFVFRDFVEVTQ